MYESQFGFQFRPFTATPNADRFFPTENTQQAFDSVASCIERASGAVLVVGASGMGKSVFLQAIGRHFQQDYSVAILESPSLNSRRELLQSILFELGLPFRGMEEGELRLTLMDYLKPSDRCPNGLLLCVDEAHLLPTNLLEEMRMITNLVREGQPRARLVLAGNASIEERLADPALESLSQRISTRAYLQPMNSAECRRYTEANVESVGAVASQVFDEECYEAIYFATNGIPRLVNQVCDHAFVLATADGQTRITKEMINEAWSDIQRLPVEWHVLGAETDSQNEHVIEFGPLDSDEDFSSPANSESSAEVEAAESDEMTADDVPAETENQKEPEPAEFVFDGPTNPFLETFQEEELIVDSFSQVIGHSPQKPSFPQEPNRPISVDMEMENPAEPSTAEINASEADENQPLDHDDTDVQSLISGIEKTSSEEDTNFSTDPAETHSEVDSETSQSIHDEHEEQPQVASNSEAVEPTNEQSSLDQYLAQSADAITFGVGQGIYADSFQPLNADENNAENESESTEIDNCATSSDPLEERISQTVSELQKDVETVNTESTSETAEPDQATAERNDDRDMIIVQDDPVPAPADTVPIREVEVNENSTTAKREDYQQLFDRLRNG